MADMEKEQQLEKRIQELLKETETLLEDHQQNINETGSGFNIFTVLDRERKEESTHCRLIYELLNPEGSHGRGDVFLKLFFDTVIKQDFPTKGEVIVKREYSFDNGRIDLLLWGDDFCFPIEVKIDAGDQYKQIERYMQFAKKQGKRKTTIYYLTLDGHGPSKESMGNAHPELISFPCEIRNWLKRCVEATAEFPNIRVILEQYIQLIERLEGEVPMSKVTEMINKSKISYESAAEIEKALPKVRAEKMISVFSEIEEFIGKQFGNQFEKIEAYSRYPKEAEMYYSAVKQPDPSLAYRIWTDGELSVELWFQVDHYNGGFLWYGVVLHKGENGIPKTEEIERFSNAFDNKPWKDTIDEFVKKNKKYVWWVWSKMLPIDEPQTFNADDRGYSKLFGGNNNSDEGNNGDSGAFDKMMEKIKSELETQLGNIKETGLRK